MTMYYIKYGDGFLYDGRPYETLQLLTYSIAMIIELELKSSNKIHLYYLKLAYTLADVMQHLKDNRYNELILESIQLIAAEYYMTIMKE